MTTASNPSKAESLDLSCPIEKNAPARRYARFALKAGFWFFFLKGMVWLALGGAAVLWGTGF